MKIMPIIAVNNNSFDIMVIKATEHINPVPGVPLKGKKRIH